MTKDEFIQAIRLGGNPDGQYDLDEGLDKAEILAELQEA